MDWIEAAKWVGAAILLATYFLLPKFSLRQRTVTGLVLFGLGGAGICSAPPLGDLPLFQSETVAWLWIGTSAGALVLATVILVPAYYQWRG